MKQKWTDPPPSPSGQGKEINGPRHSPKCKKTVWPEKKAKVIASFKGASVALESCRDSLSSA